MKGRIISYFESYESFVQAQYGFRRRFLGIWYKRFSRRIVNRIKKESGYYSGSEEFIYSLATILNIPSEIIVSERESQRILGVADKTLACIYNLLGSGDVVIDPIDWHIDFKTGFKWLPGTFYRDYIQEDISTASDVKIPRELSRSHHLLKLALAYKLTKDEKYAKTCVSQICNWIDANPLMYSINWGCTMDVAIRAVNWIWVLGLISGTEQLNKPIIAKVKESLYQHGWFIYRNPEKAISNSGNHYLADLSGQIQLGLIFKGEGESMKWLNKGKEELFREIRHQILPTGMSYERSTNYNRLVLELVLIPILTLKNNRHEIPSDICYRIESMFDFLKYALKPDGTSPIIGDQDNGRLLPFGTEGMNDFRYLLSLGGVLFHRSDLKRYGDGFNIYCSILGGDSCFELWSGLQDSDALIESKYFSDSGVCILREGQDYLLFNITGKGLYPELKSGTHTHSDLLSFELYTHDRTFLIDPGSYVYTADADQRMLFRSTKMHNTVTVDGESQNRINREVLWDFTRDAIPRVHKWESLPTHDLVCASHNGYTRLQEPVVHERTVIFNKLERNWTILDSIDGTGHHLVEFYFHFDAGIDFEIRGSVVRTKCDTGKNIMLCFDPITPVSLTKEKSYVSKSYGAKEPAWVLRICAHQMVPVFLKTVIKQI